MTFKVGDKIILRDSELKKFGISDLKIRTGIVKKVYAYPRTLIKVQRGETVEPWHIDFWRKK